MGVATNGDYFFSGKDLERGRELWVSDGTLGGTELLLDIYPGPPDSFPLHFTVAGSLVYFSAGEREFGRELWVSDGTALGTQRVVDLAPGAADSNPDNLVWDGTQLFFTATTPANGTELWVWDGSAATLLELLPGSGGVDPDWLAAGPTGGVYFAADLPDTGLELFFSDGTSPGTDLVLDLIPGTTGSGPSQLTVVGSRVAFVASTPSQGIELVVWNPLTESEAIFDNESGSGSSFPGRLTVQGQYLRYVARTSTHGRELWSYYALTGVNERLTDLGPGAADGLAGNAGLAVLGDDVCFAATGDTMPATGEELWCYSRVVGGVIGPQLVRDIEPGASGSSITQLVAVGDRLYFSVSPGGACCELWSSDATEGGTQLHADVFSQPSSDPPRALDELPGRVLFGERGGAGDTWVLAETPGVGTWSSLSSGVQASSSNPLYITPDGEGGAVFAAYRPDIGREPWVLDGEGVRPLVDGLVGPDSFDPGGLLLHRGRTLMTTVSSAIADEPYAWDGVVLSQINLRGNGDSNPSGLQPVGDLVLTAAVNSAGDRVLWSIDPIAETAQELTADRPGEVVGAGDLAFFDSSTFPFEGDLWKTDGTPLGTELVLAADSGDEFFDFITLAPAAGPDAPLVLALYLDADPFTSELWVTNGSAAGTTALLGGFQAFAFDFSPQHAAVSAGRLLLSAKRPTSDYYELFVSDGTVGGTQQVTQRETAGNFEPASLFLTGPVEGGWIYQDSRADTGAEYWFTDGTITRLLEIAPGAVSGAGPAGELPFGGQAGVRVGGDLIFSAYTPARGFELYRSDGTVAGTVPIDELLPGAAGQFSYLVASGDRVLHAGIGPAGEGNELVLWDKALFEDGFESGSANSWSSSVP